MKRFLTDLDAAAVEPVFDRRKAKRLFLNFSVEISGIDRTGQPFVERTKTLDISDAGCRLFTNIHLEPGAVVNIRLTIPEGAKLPEEHSQQFQIMWVEPNGPGWTVGARKIVDGEIWKVSFPSRKTSS